MPRDTSPLSKPVLQLDWPLWLLLQSLVALQRSPLGNFEKKNDLLLRGPGNYRAHLGPHSELTGTETAQAWGSALFGVKVKSGDLGFRRLTINEFKT